MKNQVNEWMQNRNDQDKRNTLVYQVFRSFLEHTTDLVFVKDEQMRYVAASMAFVKMAGKEKEEDIVNYTDNEIFEDKQLAMRYAADDRKLIKSGEDLVNYIEPLTEENGRVRYGSTSKFILNDENGRFLGILGITRDITKDYLIRQHYQKELQFLFEMPENAYAVSYLDIDNWRMISDRRKMIQNKTLQHCNTIEEMIEAAKESIVDKECEGFLFYRDFTAENLRRIYMKGKNRLSFLYRCILSDQSVRWVHNEISFLTDVDSGYLCMIISVRTAPAGIEC